MSMRRGHATVSAQTRATLWRRRRLMNSGTMNGGWRISMACLGGEEGGVVGEFLVVCRTGGVEVAAPGFVGPAGDSDGYLARQGGCPPCGCMTGAWMTKIEAGLQGGASYKRL